MKIACSLVLILVFCAQVRAQQVPVSTGAAITAPAAAKKRAPKRKVVSPAPMQAQTAAQAPAQAQNASPAPRTAPKAAAAAVQKAVKKAPPVEEEEPGAVIIDPRPNEDRAGRFTDNRAAGETEEPAAPAGMPASYGQLKGSLNDAGRSLLVFENGDGEITFVQVFIGKNAVTWKTISNIRRGADAGAE